MAVYDLSITGGLLSTTRAVRKRLDFERPVSNDIIRACLELALQAPTGANRQGWRWIVITDRDKRNAMGEIYRRGAGTYLEDGQRNADTTGAAQDSRVFSSAQYLAANIQKAPVHVIPCIAVDQLPVDPPRHVWPGLGTFFRRYGAFSSRCEPVVSAQLLPPSICAVVTRRQSFLAFPPTLCRSALCPLPTPSALTSNPRIARRSKTSRIGSNGKQA